MAGTFRAQLQFSQQSSIDYGWSCNFWNNKDTASAVVTVLETMRNLLVAMMGGQAIYRGYRVADYSVKRKVISDVSENAVAAAVTTTNDTDFPTTSLLVSMWNGDTNRTNQWISGLQDYTITNVGRVKKTEAAFKTAFANWKSHMVAPANGWCIRQMDTTKPAKAIKSIDLVTGIIDLYEAHGLALNTEKKVNLSGIVTPKKLNGVKKVTATDTTHLQLMNWTSMGTSAVCVLKNPYSREWALVLKAIEEVYIERTTKHDRGGPIKRGIGRRKHRV